MSDRAGGKARAAKAHAEWLASPETHAATEQALEANARLCMGEPSGAEFPCSTEMQVKFAKRIRRNFFSRVDEFNADQAAKDDAAWDKEQKDKESIQQYQITTQ